jgi:hypothetical protein
MIEKIRAVFFKNALGKLLAEQKRHRKIHTLDSARSIGVLFDASSEATQKEVAEFVKNLEKDGKKVRLLGFFNAKQTLSTPTFDSFNLKETAWPGKPKSEKAATFTAEKFDLLLSFNPDDLPALTCVAAASQAAMKIGLATPERNDFDIQLETPDGKGMRFFTEQLRIYLDKIVLTKS